MDNNKILKATAEALAKLAQERRDKQMKDDRNQLVNQINATIGPILIPYLKEMVENTKMHKGEMQEMMAAVVSDLRRGIKEALSNLKLDNISADIKIPEIKIPDFPEIKVPTPQVTVNFDTSKIRIAPPVMPSEMTVKGSVKLDGVDLSHPLPVQMRDQDGKPVNFFENLTTIIGGQSSGGKSDFFTVKGFSQSAYSDLTNADGRVRVSVETGGSGLTDSELRASSVPVEQVSGSIWSTYISGATGTLAANIVDSSGVAYSGSNPVPVVITSGATATTAVQNLNGDGTYRDTFPVSGTVAVSGVTGTLGANIVDSSGVAYTTSNPLPINDAGGTLTVDGTVAVSGLTGSIGATILNGEGVARDTWGASQVGTWDIGTVTVVTGVTNTVAASLADSSGVAYNSTNGLPIRLASGTGSSMAVNISDSSGIGYSGSNPVPTTIISGYLTSCVAVGATLHGAADIGAAPQKVGGVAVTTANPTAVTGGDIVNFRGDDLGRQIIRPVQVRDLISTAYLSKTTGSTFGTETTLFAGATNTYHDLIYVLASNDSTAAIGMDIRGTTGGNILMHLEIPANGVVGIATPVPLPAGDVGASWTVDLPDVTGTNVYVSALFSKEV